MNEIDVDRVLRKLVQVIAEQVSESPMTGITASEAAKRFLDHLEAKGNRPRTIHTYRQRLAPFLAVFGATQVGDIEPHHIDAYLRHLHSEHKLYEDHPKRETEVGRLSAATIDGRVQSLKSFFKWCVKRRYCRTNPTEHVARTGYDPTDESYAMRLSDLKAMIAVAREKAMRYAKPRDYALILFLADTGARIGETVDLRIEHLYLPKLEAVVFGKTGRGVVDYTEQTGRAIEYWLKLRPPCDHNYVFCTFGRRPGRPLTPRSAYSILKRLAGAAKVEGRFNPHAIRHLVGQIYTDNTNLELTRKKLRHKSIATTQRYANQDRARLKRATKKLSPLQLEEKDEDG